jgi:hypothetical protein
MLNYLLQNALRSEPEAASHNMDDSSLGRLLACMRMPRPQRSTQEDDHVVTVTFVVLSIDRGRKLKSR